MDKIIIKDLKIFANHGVLPEENIQGQYFYVSCELSVNLRKAGLSDELSETVNYAEICYVINTVMQENTFALIETCAEKTAEEILKFDDRIKAVKVSIKKPSAPIGLELECPIVEITRKKHEVYIALGSNLGDSRELIDEAVKKIDAMEDTKVEKVSELIVTKPYGVTDQPDFLNGVLKCTTLKTPYELLDSLHQIENEGGRVRNIRWGARTLDLDIIFYDDLVLEDTELCIPHADMQNRDFVLKPLMEIAPYKVHPLYGLRVSDLYKKLNEQD